MLFKVYKNDKKINRCCLCKRISDLMHIEPLKLIYFIIWRKLRRSESDIRNNDKYKYTIVCAP